MRSPTMFFWISVAPPAIPKRSAKRAWKAQRPPSGAPGAPRHSCCAGPRIWVAASAIFLYVSVNASFSTEPSGPGGSPRSRGGGCRGPRGPGGPPAGARTPPGQLEHTVNVLVEDDRVPDCHPLVHEHRDRDVPAAVQDAEQVRPGHPDLIEEHLAELGIPGDLDERPDRDAGTLHVHEKARDPLLVRGLGGGANSGVA